MWFWVALAEAQELPPAPAQQAAALLAPVLGPTQAAAVAGTAAAGPDATKADAKTETETTTGNEKVLAAGSLSTGEALVGGLAAEVQGTSVSTAVRLLLMLTGLTFLPAMLIVMTPFVRFVMVFSLLRQALGLNSSPPNQVIVGLSLFLSLTVMEPTLLQSWNAGVNPFLSGQMETGPALEATLEPLRTFMLANTRRTDMATVLHVARLGQPDALGDLPTSAIVSAFVLSELKTAMLISVYLFVPFLVIDLVVSSVLLGMGMMMLPPVVVSLPFKIVIFVLIDGWGLLVRDLAQGIVR
jgi:flagellar biosynthesis protein FliP